MHKVTAEHIAYSAVHACYSLTSHKKWKQHDGVFDYTDFYYRILNFLTFKVDKKWHHSLYSYLNSPVHLPSPEHDTSAPPPPVPAHSSITPDPSPPPQFRHGGRQQDPPAQPTASGSPLTDLGNNNRDDHHTTTDPPQHTHKKAKTTQGATVSFNKAPAKKKGRKSLTELGYHLSPIFAMDLDSLIPFIALYPVSAVIACEVYH
ncbi:hypothetical protein EDD16DRAFT_1707331 [Pisolithus croceorrhizus]|nr:hypothetical protein EDD16DRAFT_1707331 [Pisolithus croceorrhizus]KAI6135393.1 hypothetical protein EV401DRAFT_2063058 [Pisolithus croceorrhizus]KAI6158976.1 hypothetical protein EDD17DRAFT_1762918 [Pisolithus thermaeus]